MNTGGRNALNIRIFQTSKPIYSFLNFNLKQSPLGTHECESKDIIHAILIVLVHREAPNYMIDRRCKTLKIDSETNTCYRYTVWWNLSQFDQDDLTVILTCFELIMEKI